MVSTRRTSHPEDSRSSAAASASRSLRGSRRLKEEPIEEEEEEEEEESQESQAAWNTRLRRQTRSSALQNESDGGRDASSDEEEGEDGAENEEQEEGEEGEAGDEEEESQSQSQGTKRPADGGIERRAKKRRSREVESLLFSGTASDRRKQKENEKLTYVHDSNSEESSGEEEEGGARYSLRERRGTRRQITNMKQETHRGRPPPRVRNPYIAQYKSKPSHRGHRRRGGSRHDYSRGHYDSSSESDGSNPGAEFSDKEVDEERHFQRHQLKQKERELNAIQPIAGGDGGGSSSTGQRAKSSGNRDVDRDVMRADAVPLEIDASITWESIGGLGSHVRALKEMVQLPLMYPEVFERFGMQPPRGILFHGPPGTGKTLTARALANACSNSTGQRVAFFMKKGADCLSKWVGEAERQLRLLFEQAKRHAPAVIFFDEIDGLAPVRSARQDQIHASIVSTLLALMDGLDSRGQVVVIGATNRPDAVDPALRRPGRFDRELVFALPDCAARRTIIDIHTKQWQPQPPDELKAEIAKRTVGYCGADLRALCAEATLKALRRHYPQIYASEAKLLLDPTSVHATRADFASAMRHLTPSAHRACAAVAAPLPRHLETLLAGPLSEAVTAALEQLPHPPGGTASSAGEEERAEGDSDVEDAGGERGMLMDGGVDAWRAGDSVHRPRVVLWGKEGQGQVQIAAAALHALEGLQCFSLDLASLLADPSLSPEAALIARMTEARRSAPCVVYLPGAQRWWGPETSSLPLLRSTLASLLNGLPETMPVLVLATIEGTQGLYSSPESLRRAIFGTSQLIPTPAEASGGDNSDGECEAGYEGARMVGRFGCVVPLPDPPLTARSSFVDALQVEVSHVLLGGLKTAVMRTHRRNRPPPPPLPLAPPPAPKTDEGEEVSKAELEREEHCHRELRIFLREIIHELRKERKNEPFMRPIDPAVLPDYYEIIRHPMDLDTMRANIDGGYYPTFDLFLSHLRLMRTNAEAYNPCDAKDARGRSIVHAAAGMEDMALSMSHRFVARLKYDLLSKCDEINRKRQARGIFAPGHRRYKPPPGATNGYGPDNRAAGDGGIDYSRESIITDPYAGPGQAGGGARGTRASLRSLGKDGKLVVLGANGAILDQSTRETLEGPTRSSKGGGGGSSAAGSREGVLDAPESELPEGETASIVPSGDTTETESAPNTHNEEEQSATSSKAPGEKRVTVNLQESEAEESPPLLNAMDTQQESWNTSVSPTRNRSGSRKHDRRSNGSHSNVGGGSSTSRGDTQISAAEISPSANGGPSPERFGGISDFLARAPISSPASKTVSFTSSPASKSVSFMSVDTHVRADRVEESLPLSPMLEISSPSMLKSVADRVTSPSGPVVATIAEAHVVAAALAGVADPVEEPSISEEITNALEASMPSLGKAIEVAVSTGEWSVERLLALRAAVLRLSSQKAKQLCSAHNTCDAETAVAARESVESLVQSIKTLCQERH